jgi:hypothetical protein
MSLSLRLGLLVGTIGIAAIAFLGAAAGTAAFPAPQPVTRIERMDGAAAIAHMQAMFAKNPAVAAAYERSQVSLAGRGFQKVNRPVVVRQFVQRANGAASAAPRTTLHRILSYIVPKLHAQNEHAEADSSGEIFMDPWDDGDDVTWEGTYYVMRYSDGAWALYDWQNDTRNQDESYAMYYAERQGGERDPLMVRRNPNLLERLRNLFEEPVEAQSGAWRRAKMWGDCFGGACLGAATACALTGPGWGPCTGAWCIGASVTCGIYALLQ